MYISQCLIAKNEEDNIEYCLNHLKSVVDEQIVVDTGSTDRTVEIAKELGANVFHFEWINDFSVARNFAIEKAKGEWIIFLDCDEYFSNDSISLIRKIVEEVSKYKEIEGINSELINVNSENKPISVTNNASVRIFKRSKFLRYTNKIHETLKKIKNNRVTDPILIDASSKLKIFHTGYTKDAINEKGKNERNISLLLKELEQNPKSPIINLYLSKQFNLSEKYEDGLHYSLKALEYMDKNVSHDYYCSIYSIVMQNMINVSKSLIKINKIFDEAVNRYPEFPDIYFYMGIAAVKYNEIQDAIKYFEKCIHCCENYDCKIESIAIVRIIEIYKQLLNLYVLIDNKHKIVDLSVKLLNTNRYDLEVLGVLINTFLTQEKEESIIKFLNRIYDYEIFKDKIYLLKACEIIGNKYMKNFYLNLLSKEELKAIDI